MIQCFNSQWGEIMRYSIIFVLACLVLLTFLPALTCSRGDDNPYELRHYRHLDIPWGWRCNISPDGTQIVYMNNRDPAVNSRAIWVADADGNNIVMLYRNSTIDSTFTRPVFSPDGEMILFTRIGRGIYLNILSKNGTNWDENVTLRTIYHRPKYALWQPSFSPDGKRIIFHSNEIGYKGDVWVMDIDGTNRTRLTFDDSSGYHPSYSLDGAKIVYVRSNTRGYHEIWIMNSDGSNQRRLLDDSWYPSKPVFMPDGRILFESGRFSPQSRKLGAPSIWMMDMDGSNRILLVPSRITHVGSGEPSISADGTRILFSHGIGGGLYIVDCPDGGLWKDSDGDRVADICDGYPFDPTRGYYIDDEKIPGFTTGAMVSSVLIAVPAIRRRMRVRGDRHPSPPADRGHL